MDLREAVELVERGAREQEARRAAAIQREADWWAWLEGDDDE